MCLKMWFMDIVFKDVVYGHCLKMWLMDMLFEDVLNGHAV